MSRGFVKEDDQEDIPLVPPRAFLPEGVPNYVTQEGMQALLDEKQELLNEKKTLDTINEKEKRIAVNHINAKLQLLNERILSAQIMESDQLENDTNEVRFGALVKLRIETTKKEQIFRIVGVDEANISKGKISFISPLAKALINKKKGEQAVLALEQGKRLFTILDVEYK
jgi:transcription elongation factor GreB